MAKVLLLLKQKENRRLLQQSLESRNKVLVVESENELLDSNLSFDLCILDLRALIKVGNWIKKVKKNQNQLFIPFLLITSPQNVGMGKLYLWSVIDEIITTPIEKVELTARVEMLLQRRLLSLELKRKNENLQQLNELKTRFISMASHELRNPVHVILAYSKILYKNSNLPKTKKDDYFERMKSSASKITETLDDILTLSKGELLDQNFNPMPIDLEKFCHQLILEIEVGAGYKNQISFVTKGKANNSYLDKKLLSHILINLLTNAMKYSSQGSTIDFNLIYHKEQVEFQIKDKGIGIPLKDQKRLFESFHRASNVGRIPGNGLGLVIVKQSVDLHEGKISVNSEEGVGTTFTVKLPSVAQIIHSDKIAD
ncbi:hybrid sensor histidine kinase/response regulator [Mastigocoleus testarum]|uniref:histidine kinase n=1 Tax=Mastigocoleus testarum BC008 TaxID=371196 RepID=A0A0V7ZPU4_9CYAN|nr:HAMP domain-containing sensor histidine kinase [Mastigocoleus testarum]KST66585.1 hypothetical protein BC008_43500 [Mastigocoleus testarum BC008]